MVDWAFVAITVLSLIAAFLALWAVDSSRIIRNLHQKVEGLQMILNEERVSTTEQTVRFPGPAFQRPHVSQRHQGPHLMEHEHDFKPGDIVRLKSGGPNMTVNQPGAMDVHEVSGGPPGHKAMFVFNGIQCKWFDDVGCLQEAIFNPATLTPLGPSVAPARPVPGSAADLPEGWAL